MEEANKKSGGRFANKIRAQFITGIIPVAPIGVTVWVFVFLFTTIDNILQPLIKALWGHTIPGIGFVTTIVLVYFIGLIASNVVGKRLVRYGDSLLSRVPIFRLLYTSVRQIAESFSATDRAGFLQVVLVEFPSKGIWSIGFLTNELTIESGKKVLSVFIPTAPTPTGGYLQVFPEESVIRTKITMDEAIKMIVSCGAMTPREVGKIRAV